MTWVKLDDGFFANPKVQAVGYEGAGLYAMGLSYCGKYLTDGFLPQLWVNGHPKRIVKKLVDGGLWRPVDGGYVMHDYLEINRSAEQIKEERRKKREAGKQGAEARWNAKADQQANGIADAIADAMTHAMASRDAPVQSSPVLKDLREKYVRAVNRLPVEKQHELAQILRSVTGMDADSVGVLCAVVRDAPLSRIADVRTRCVGKHIGWVVNALKEAA